MNNRLFFLVSTLLLTACASKPYVASNSEIDNYIQNLEKTKENMSFIHKDSGELRVNKEPLAPIYEECKAKAFEGFSIRLGNHEISDYGSLITIQGDYLSYLLTSLRHYKNQQNNYGAAAHAGASAALSVQTGSVTNENYSNHLSKTIFDDKNISREILRIAKVQDQKKLCLKSYGWEVKPINKNKS
jgi:hypothetical protein